jgi:molecular chaperone GrpE
MAKKDNNQKETTQQEETSVNDQITDAVTEEPTTETAAVEVDTSTPEVTVETENYRVKWQETQDLYVRLMAEFDNFRKRSRREMDAFREYASETVLSALLPVLDDFGRTLTAMEKTDNLASIKAGISLVTEKLHKTLEKEGLNEIKAAGTPFDSSLHEAIHSIEVEEDKKGTVLEEVEKGYRLKDKVIRYAKVIVGE